MSRRRVVGVAALLLLATTWVATAPSVPAFDAVVAAYTPSDARVLDRAGRVLHELRVDPGRRRWPWTALRDVAPAVGIAVVAGEDRRFYRHHGVDWWAWAAVLRGRPRGGSTLTMQLAALLDPRLGASGRARSWTEAVRRKAQQVRAAWALERSWTKGQILEAYLNLVPFRGELQGIGAAAAVLFDKAPHGVTAAEACVLAALVPSPNAPATPLMLRAAGVARVADGAVDDATLAAAVARVVDAGVGRGPRVALAPHLAHRLLRRGTASDVRATLDRDLQELATEALHRQLVAVRAQRVEDGAVLVVDNASGDVLAYVGSSGALSAAPAVDGVRAYRQPGSALKPFVYGLAIARRVLTAASVLDDTPLEIATAGGLYRPRNYDSTFRGPVALRTALASSLNVPAVRTLQLLGADAVGEHFRALGFTGIAHDGAWYGPGLALGSAEVSLWEIVNAYRTLANHGEWSPLRLTPTDSAPARTRIYDRDVAWVVADMLADRDARAETFGLEGPLSTPFWSAVKTGTSTDMRDNWCIGFTPAVTVGVWVGNASGHAMRDVSGVTGAAPAWQEIMTAVQARWPARAPSPPPELSRAAVAASGERPRDEWFLAGTEPAAIVQRLATPRARIVQPTAGTLVAIDPDIPMARQRLAFQAVGAAGAVWRLDGQELGPARGVYLWPPEPGPHELVLIAADQHRPIDRVRFDVRGQRRVAPTP